MSDFNYKVRIPTNMEYDRLVNITNEENAIIHWKKIFSWVDDPEFVAEHPTCRPNRGYTSARRRNYDTTDGRFVTVGFRPAFESLNNDTLPAGIADGDVITIGTLYMNNTPVKAPLNPMCYGDVEDYIPGATLEFKPALENPIYQVQAIKCGDILICDRCLLKNISYDDICDNFKNESPIDVKSNSVVSINPCNYKMRIPTNTEYDRLIDVTAGENAIAHWDGMLSWVDDPKLVAEYPDRRALRGYYSARHNDSTSSGTRDVAIGLRPAFEPLNNDTISAGIADGDVVVIGTLYMNGEPVKVPQNPIYRGDITHYISGAKLEFKSALDDPAYQVQVIKCGNVFICDRCLLKYISYDDIAASLKNEPPIDVQHNDIVNAEPIKYRVRIPTNEEYNNLINVANGDDAIMHWDYMLSWVDDPEFVADRPDRRPCRGYNSAHYYGYGSAGTRYVLVGFRPAFEPLDNNALPASIADGDVVVIGTLYMNGEPVRISQNPIYDGDIKNYTPDTKLEFKPALDDPAYQVQAIRCGNVLICDRCILNMISYKDIDNCLVSAFVMQINKNDTKTEKNGLINGMDEFESMLTNKSLAFFRVHNATDNTVTYVIKTNMKNQVISARFFMDKHTVNSYIFKDLCSEAKDFESELAAAIKSALAGGRYDNIHTYYGDSVVPISKKGA